MTQMKGQDKTLENQLNEVETGNLPGKEFRIKIVKMIQDLRKRMEKMQEVFTKDQKNQRTNKQMNNTLEGISGRISKAEERISDLEDRIVEINATRQNTEKRMEKKKKKKTT